MNFSQRAVKSSLLLAGRERGEALGEESSQNCLHFLVPGGCGSLTQDAGALCPVQWQWVQALSLHQPLVFSGDIRTWGSFYPWQRGSWSGCEQVLPECSTTSVEVPLPSFQGKLQCLNALCNSHFHVQDACPCTYCANPLG